MSENNKYNCGQEQNDVKDCATGYSSTREEYRKEHEKCSFDVAFDYSCDSDPTECVSTSEQPGGLNLDQDCRDNLDDAYSQISLDSSSNHDEPSFTIMGLRDCRFRMLDCMRCYTKNAECDPAIIAISLTKSSEYLGALSKFVKHLIAKEGKRGFITLHENSDNSSSVESHSLSPEYEEQLKIKDLLFTHSQKLQKNSSGSFQDAEINERLQRLFLFSEAGVEKLLLQRAFVFLDRATCLSSELISIVSMIETTTEKYQDIYVGIYNIFEIFHKIAGFSFLQEFSETEKRRSTCLSESTRFCNLLNGLKIAETKVNTSHFAKSIENKVLIPSGILEKLAQCNLELKIQLDKVLETLYYKLLTSALHAIVPAVTCLVDCAAYIYNRENTVTGKLKLVNEIFQIEDSLISACHDSQEKVGSSPRNELEVQAPSTEKLLECGFILISRHLEAYHDLAQIRKVLESLLNKIHFYFEELELFVEVSEKYAQFS